jgi:NADH-quinone oxidoreductase subunit K
LQALGAKRKALQALGVECTAFHVVGLCAPLWAILFLSHQVGTPFRRGASMAFAQYTLVSMILFLLGIWGIFLNRRNILVMLMSIELLLLAVNLLLLTFSVCLDDLVGQVFALLILTVAAAESAIGLALLVIYYRVRGTIQVEFISLLKG